MALDPIEKKPLARFHEGSQIVSVGGFGCNLDCPFCQNCHIAHPTGSLALRDASPEQVVAQALALRQRGNIGIAFTYNEPLIGFEYVRDTAKLAKEHGLKTVCVSNGFTTDATLDAVLPWIDAWNLDLKGNDAFYRSLGGALAPVQNTISRAAKRAHVELTMLVIPGKNDDLDAFRGLVDWIASVDADIPLHLSRFFPAHRWNDVPPTPVATLRIMADIAREKLSTVLLGNV